MNLSPVNTIVILALIRLSLGLQFQSVGSLSPFLMAELTLDYATLGLLIGIVQFPSLVLALPAGWLNARLGERTIALSGLALMAVGGTVVSIAWDGFSAIAGRLLSGTGSALLSVVLMKMVFDRFSGVALPVAVGFLMAAWPAGQALALATLPLLAEWHGWRVAMGSTAIFCALGFLVFAAVLTPKTPGDAPQMTRLVPGELSPLLAAAIIWGLFNSALNIILGYGPSYFISTGLSPAHAGAVVSLLTVPFIPLIPLGGMLSRFTSRPLVVTGILLLGMTLIVVVSTNTSWPGPTFLALGVVMGIPCAVMAALPGQMVTQQSRAIGLGISTMTLAACTTVLPPLAGWARDATQVPAAPLYVAAACFIGCLLALSWLRTLRRATVAIL